MSYKDEMKKEIENILQHKESATERLYTYIETFFERAVYESNKTGQSIESITYEILEGLEESYEAHPQEIEELLSNCSTIMIDVVHMSSLRSLEKKNQKIIQARVDLREALETEKACLVETFHTFKDYAEDNAHADFQKSLHQTESDIIKRIGMFSDHIKGNIQHH